MTFSKHDLEKKIAWVDPQFLASQFECATTTKRNVEETATTLDIPSSPENQIPAQTISSQLKQKVSNYSICMT